MEAHITKYGRADISPFCNTTNAALDNSSETKKPTNSIQSTANDTSYSGHFYIS